MKGNLTWSTCISKTSSAFWFTKSYTIWSLNMVLFLLKKKRSGCERPLKKTLLNDWLVPDDCLINNRLLLYDNMENAWGRSDGSLMTVRWYFNLRIRAVLFEQVLIFGHMCSHHVLYNASILLTYIHTWVPPTHVELATQYPVVPVPSDKLSKWCEVVVQKYLMGSRYAG